MGVWLGCMAAKGSGRRMSGEDRHSLFRILWAFGAIAWVLHAAPDAATWKIGLAFASWAGLALLGEALLSWRRKGPEA